MKISVSPAAVPTRLRTRLLLGTALLASLVGTAPPVFAATLDLQGVDQKLPIPEVFNAQSYLNGSDNLTNNGAPGSPGGVATLTEGGAPAGTVYSGTISDGDSSQQSPPSLPAVASRTGVVHTGGDLIITGNNTFTGGLTIAGGSVTVGSNQALGGPTNAVTLSGTDAGLIIGNTFDGTGTPVASQIGSLTVAEGTVNVSASNASFTAPVQSNGGTIRNGGRWTGDVQANTGAIGNTGSWTGQITSNAGRIGNTGSWTGDVIANGGILANAGVWAGKITNSAKGTFYNAGSLVRGLTNDGTVNAIGGAAAPGAPGSVFQGAIINPGMFNVTGPQAIDLARLSPALAGVGTFDSTGVVTASADFDNSGLLDVQGGSFTIAGNLRNAAGGTVTVAAGATLTDALNNSGMVTNAGTYNADVVNAAAGQIFNRSTATWNGAVTSNLGTIGNSGQWTGAVASNVGTIGNSGVWTGDVVANAGTIANLGTWNGHMANGAGGTVFNAGAITGGLDNAGTVMAFGGASLGPTTTQGAIDGPITNSGTFVVVGPGTVPGSLIDPSLPGSVFTDGNVSSNGDFANSGSLVIQNGATYAIGGRLANSGTVDLSQGIATLKAGSYSGAPGSSAVVAVDLRARGTSPTAGQASQLSFNTASGSTNLRFQSLSQQGLISYYPQVQVVSVTSGANSVFTADSTSLKQLSNGLVSYSFSNGALIGGINPNGATTAAVQATAALTTLNSNFFQDWQPFERDTFITAPQDPPPNTIEGGPWIRGKFGHENDDVTTTAGNVGGRSRASADFSGFQVGGDVGRFNINGSGWNAIAGLTGGEFFATSNEKLGGSTRANIEIPFVGAYGALTKGPFFVDVLYHHDFYGLRLNDASLGLSNQLLSGNGDSVHFDGQYTFALGNYGALGNLSVTPMTSIIASRVDLDNLPFRSLQLGMIKFNTIDSVLGRAGVKVASSYVTSTLALQPFVMASVWHEFEGAATSEFDSFTGFAVPLSVSRVGTFGQAGLGLNAELLGKNLFGTLRGDFRFGDKTDGESVTAQVRYTF